MGICVGIDVGSVSVKLAAVADGHDRRLLEHIAVASPEFRCIPQSGDAQTILLSQYRRIQGGPVSAASALFETLARAGSAALGNGTGVSFESRIAGISAVGTGSKLISTLWGASCENEFRALARGVGFLYPNVRTLFEMGGESSKFIQLDVDADSGETGITDYETNGDCAAGTGSFIDQQALRLRYRVEEIGDIVLQTPTAARIAGRCSVFAKSDMIHAQQKGFTPPQILKGLCDAVARNYKSSITKGKRVKPQVAFIGGLARNKGVAQSLKQLFELGDEDFFVPEFQVWIGAIGAALLSQKRARPDAVPDIGSIGKTRLKDKGDFPTLDPLSLDNVCLLRNQIVPRTFDNAADAIDVYLGIDIGSVSTNLAVVDNHGQLLKEIYLRTEGRPIEQVQNGLREIENEMGSQISIRGVGTTGSGRELIGKLVGADTVNDEITAHKAGAMYISEKLTGETVDTIFEIGGQDSKFISIQDGIVIDFAMNEACAAGTGSFLEEQAEKLGVRIKGEFSDLALRSENPIRLGERCTVFMEQDINAYLQRGATVEDLVAGLAYSIVLNYLNRVVRGRRIGRVIYFQGGTAYNDSVAAAFSRILGKRIIVPPHNGVVGAIGMALLAREKVVATGRETTFRGYDLQTVDYTLREFVCKACSNYCDIQEFKVEDEKTFWGDKCSDKFRKRTRIQREVVTPDLVALRRKLLFAEFDPERTRPRRIGIPMAMSLFETFPFWNRFFDELGYQVVVSGDTNTSIARDGSDLVVAEPCHPIKVAHGHVKALLAKEVDYILVPNVLDGECSVDGFESMHCPWNQTLPFVLRGVPRFEAIQDKFLSPTLHFRQGPETVTRELMSLAAVLGVSRLSIGRAADKAFASQGSFRKQLLQAGRQALDRLLAANEPGIVLVGRVYNIYDKDANLDIPGKLRDYYGVSVLPLDFLPVGEISVADINENMFWLSGQKILAAARLVGRHANLHIIYFTNFKCGPDSFIKHFVDAASGKPFLCIQFDGHSNDAGFLTRCEAYLDSKGFLRRWQTGNPSPNGFALPGSGPPDGEACRQREEVYHGYTS